ncbi:MBL fold metallo-hydrolase [Anaeromyxobacter dehalogenans]|uniref:Beta-lactamase-like protein n=1 Tax=Anaeromyxobacter dehalogenans (strain 2CP-C) TaxID=290397 RepID=Q2IDJ8_ANADE|nr:MBL fold metallo-hydrolase [Anaeromyxobacter dehalogenans]ABC82657.1 Beta-lactamase-like protein [Anaeromyxobacter dehalogenans 2CP-C]
MLTNTGSGTRVDEVAAGTFRISTPIPPAAVSGGFSFNQYLVVDEQPLLFHTGPRRLFPLVREAVAAVMPVEDLRWIGFSHYEADECGSLNEWLAAAPRAEPLCGRIAAMVSISDVADRAPRALADGEALRLGRHEVTWIDAPHLPHGWECGYLFDGSTGTLLCGDLFTQPGCAEGPAVTAGDILGPSEALRRGLDYFSGTRSLSPLVEKLAARRPTTLACMHGQAWEGDGAALLRALGDALGSSPAAR